MEVDRKELFRSLRTAVVKLGTNVVTRKGGEMALGRVHSLIEELADVRRGGIQIILVTSGAISMGMHRLGLAALPERLADRQACAAVGQIRLMSVYQQAFSSYGIPVAQILLTEDDFSNRERYLNLRNTMSRLLELDVLPIVNENDSVSTAEIEERGERGRRVFGDNDVLSALVASKLGADLLVLLSDVPGLLPAAPRKAGEAHPIPVVREITPEIEAAAGAAGEGGRGGMVTKIEAARIATAGGTLAVIANGHAPGILRRVFAGEPEGTLFLPRGRLRSRKRWIAFASKPAGRVLVNRGAREALVERRSSLLLAGVVALEGEFRRGDVVSILDEDRREFARGIANFPAAEARPLLGKRSDEITGLAGKDKTELVNRDTIVIVR